MIPRGQRRQCALGRRVPLGTSGPSKPLDVISLVLRTLHQKCFIVSNIEHLTEVEEVHVACQLGYRAKRTQKQLVTKPFVDVAGYTTAATI